jgi:outer membrane protein
MRKEQGMKNGWGLLVIATGMALAFWQPAWAVELKIGVIEPQKVLDGTKNGKKIKDALAEYVKSRQRIIDLEEEDLKKMEEDLVKQGSVLSGEAKKEKEEAFRKRMVEYQRKVTQFNQEVQGKKKEVLDEFNKTLEQIIKGIADKEKLSLVVEKGDNGAGALIIYNHPSLDLTDRVIKELDKVAK